MAETTRTLEPLQQEAIKLKMSESEWINGGFQQAGWKTWFSKTGEPQRPLTTQPSPIQR